MTRPVPACAVALVKKFEGFRGEAYQCPAGKWTIGYGHTSGVEEGDTISEGEAETVLYDDLRDAADVVESAVKAPLNDNQFGALVSFVFNIGAARFLGSTLLKMLNKGTYRAVPVQLDRWNMAGGQVLGGLVRRRKAEAELWGRAV